MKIRGKAFDDGNKKSVEITVPLKQLSNFWRTLETPLINSEISLNLTWSLNCVITNSAVEVKLTVTNTKLHVLVAALSTEDNAKLLQQLKFGFEKTISWDRHLAKKLI